METGPRHRSWNVPNLSSRLWTAIFVFLCVTFVLPRFKTGRRTRARSSNAFTTLAGLRTSCVSVVINTTKDLADTHRGGVCDLRFL